MTAGFQFGDSRAKRRMVTRRTIECLLLFTGLAAIDYYIWANAAAALFQAYDHWSFTEQLQGRAASALRFVLDEMGSLAGQKRSQAYTSEPGSAKLSRSTGRLRPLAMVGTIEIPRLHVSLMVREGVTEATLGRAVGHIPSTALPGQLGNVAFAAHRDTFFRPLRDIRRGDAITVQTLDGTYRYQVRSIQIVPPQGTWVLNASNQAELTLITCYPFYFVGPAPKRFVVKAVQVAGNRGHTAAPQSG